MTTQLNWHFLPFVTVDLVIYPIIPMLWNDLLWLFTFTTCKHWRLSNRTPVLNHIVLCTDGTRHPKNVGSSQKDQKSAEQSDDRWLLLIVVKHHDRQQTDRIVRDILSHCARLPIGLQSICLVLKFSMLLFCFDCRCYHLIEICIP